MWGICEEWGSASLLFTPSECFSLQRRVQVGIRALPMHWIQAWLRLRQSNRPQEQAPLRFRTPAPRKILIATALRSCISLRAGLVAFEMRHKMQTSGLTQATPGVAARQST
ncbi:hypothetical protein DSECCO2_659050 [anaerobic digester metagenome]